MKLTPQQISRSIPPWYPIITEPASELRALRSLAYALLNPFLPMVRGTERSGGDRKRYVVKAMVSGYIFAHLPEKFGDWDRIRALPGIVDVMRVAGQIVTLSDEAICFLRAVEADLARPRHKRCILGTALPEVDHSFKPGDKVRATTDAGAWAGYEAVIQALDERDRIALEIILPGRMVPVTMPAQWLELVG